MLAKLENMGRRFEDAVLLILLVSMILLASLQIFLRNGFDTGFIWADELLRIQVLWLALFGSVAASRADRHISIDVLSRTLNKTARRVSAVFVDVFTCAVCALLCFHSARFVADARTFEDTLMDTWPAWWFQAALPLCFGLMAYRYGIFALARSWRLLRGRDDPATSSVTEQ